MRTAEEGGFVHRMMPPVDYDFGPIPEACYDKKLSRREIEELLLSSYRAPERVSKLAESADPMEIQRAKWAIEIVAEIDSLTIMAFNMEAKVQDEKNS
jgi:hypothetical protein